MDWAQLATALSGAISSFFGAQTAQAQAQQSAYQAQVAAAQAEAEKEKHRTLLLLGLAAIGAIVLLRLRRAGSSA